MSAAISILIGIALYVLALWILCGVVGFGDDIDRPQNGRGRK